jgi:hypothetical protein
MKKSMKKFMVACAAVSAMTVVAGMSAMAATYDEATNTATYAVPAAAEGTQMTVLVIPTSAKTNVQDSDILYINQDAVNGTGVNGTAKLKGTDKLADGDYVAMVGYYDSNSTFQIAEDPFHVGNATETHEILMGDINGDEDIDSVDSQQILRYSVKGTASFASDKDKLFAADINVDGDVDSVDAQQILRYSVKGTSTTKVGKTAVVDADYNVIEFK